MLKKSIKRRPVIELSALAAVLLVLLFAFMIRSTYTPDLPRNTVDLVKADHPVALPGAVREDAIHITVQRDGRIYFGDQQIPSSQLAAKLRDAVKNGAEPRLYIQADPHAKYGAVSQVLNVVRSAGIEDVSFVTQPGN